MEAICRCLDVSFLKEESVFQHGLSVIPWQERREKALSYRHENDRLLSLGASLLLNQMLKDAGVCDVTLNYGPYGKPLLASGQLHFSLSHSGTMAVCAVSSQPVGVDVEVIRPIPSAEILRFFHPEEVSFIEQTGYEPLEILRIWTRRESYGKRNGIGIAGAMKKLSFLEAEPDDSRSFHEYMIDNHLITVCTGKQESVSFSKTVFTERI